MGKSFIVYGAGGLGREVRILAELSGRWEKFMGFIDDGIRPGNPCDEAIILGGFEYLKSIRHDVDLLVGIANTKIKASIFKRTEGYSNIKTPTLIASDSYIEKDAVIGEGSIIGHFCFVSTKARLGRGTFLNTAAQVGHDSSLGDFCSLMPTVNISGNVTIGKETFFGVQSLILQGLTVGERAIIGAGSVAIKDVPPNCTVAGSPARVLKGDN